MIKQLLGALPWGVKALTGLLNTATAFRVHSGNAGTVRMEVDLTDDMWTRLANMGALDILEAGGQAAELRHSFERAGVVGEGGKRGRDDGP